MPPDSMWRISLRFSATSRERSALRQSGGAAKSDSIKRAGVRLGRKGDKDRQNVGGGTGGGWGGCVGPASGSGGVWGGAMGVGVGFVSRRRAGLGRFGGVWGARWGETPRSQVAT